MWYGTVAGLRWRPTVSGSICAGAEVVEPVHFIVRDLGDIPLMLLSLAPLGSIRTMLCRYVIVQLVCTRLCCLGWTTVTRVFQLWPSSLAAIQPILHSAASLVCVWSRDSSPERSTLATNQGTRRLQIACRRVAPCLMSDTLPAGADVPSLIDCTSSSGDYVVSRTRLEFGERAFAVAAPRIWNKRRQLKSTK